MARAGRPTDQVDEGILEGTVREVAELEARERGKESVQNRVADRITAATGNMRFAAGTITWITAWVVLNLPGMPTQFDPFPFPILAILVPVEALILAVFVLISENAQARRADRRARIEMQVNILAEREISKLVGLVAEIHEHLDLQRHSRDEVDEMQNPTLLEDVADTVEAVETARENS